MDLLCSLLEFGVSSKEGEEAAIHILIILGLLTDSGEHVCTEGNLYLNIDILQYKMTRRIYN